MGGRKLGRSDLSDLVRVRRDVRHTGLQPLPMMSEFYPIKPCPKPRMTKRDKWKKRPAVLRYRAFKDKCRLCRVKLPQPCRIVFWLPMPKSWPPSKQAKMQGQPHQQKPDLDNLIKGLWDATQKKDERLWCVQAEKRWGVGKGCIEVRPLEDQVRRLAA